MKIKPNTYFNGGPKRLHIQSMVEFSNLDENQQLLNTIKSQKKQQNKPNFVKYNILNANQINEPLNIIDNMRRKVPKIIQNVISDESTYS